MGKGKVEHKLGNDGKVRKVGDVGSHSTLVREAKTPIINISSVEIITNSNKVKIPQTTVESIYPNNNDLIIIARSREKEAMEALDIAQSELLTAYDANPELVAARDRMEKDHSSEASALVDKIKSLDIDILKADLSYISARAHLYRAVNHREIVETTTMLDEASRLHTETMNVYRKLREGIPELVEAYNKIGILDATDEEHIKYVADYGKLLKTYPEVSEAWAKAKLTAKKVTLLSLKLRKLKTTGLMESSYWKAR